jgi:glutathione S-transferase
MITVYGHSVSGNCHEPRLLLGQPGREYRRVEIGSSKGEARVPGYLVKNPNGRVSMVEFENGRVLTESNT